jgi:ferredoxin
MLMIHPDECINCGACETECPVEAIYEDTGVPEQYQGFVQLNSDRTMALSDDELDSHRLTSKD